MQLLPNQNSPFVSSLRQNWLWIAAGLGLFIAFLVVFLQYKKQKRRLKAAHNALEYILEKNATTSSVDTKPTDKNPVENEQPIPVEPQPLAYEIPVFSPLLHFKVRPMPSPYPGAVQMEAWDNLRFKFVRLTRDPEGRVARGENDPTADAWILELCHHSGRLAEKVILPIENDAEPTSAQITAEIKALLAKTLAEETPAE